jgi:hypothetical protein
LGVNGPLIAIGAALPLGYTLAVLIPRNTAAGARVQ